jgi:hypothetical protein
MECLQADPQTRKNRPFDCLSSSIPALAEDFNARPRSSDVPGHFYPGSPVAQENEV